jgi:TPR repeat protein
MCGAALLANRRRVERRTENTKAIGGPRAVPVQKPPATPADHVDDSNHAATSYLGAPSPSSQKPRGEWVRSSGSSFLGLEDEAPSDSEYLLTDEEPRSGGAWRALLALVILAVVGYLILKNWDSPTFAAAIAQIQKHTQSASNPEPKPQPPPSSEQPSISTDESAASADAQKGPANTAQQDATKTPQQDLQKKDAPDGAPPDKSAGASAESTTDKSSGGLSKDKTDDIASKKEPNKNEGAVPENDRNEEKDSAPADKPNKSSRENSKSTEPASSTPAPAQDLYERGQAYLSGRGAPQSCDQGVVYTRAAAQQGNPKAAVQMGALYATGRCVSQDRVQAYNWFNEALRNDPNNEYVERSRSTLWAQMTSEERQRAAKSQ